MDIKKWLLKSIPLQNLLLEWAKTRNIKLINENAFSKEIKELFYKYKIGVFPSNYLLVDFKNYHITLFLKEEYLPANQIQDYIEELEEFLFYCGRNIDDFKIIKINFKEYLNNEDLYPLFFIIWKPEKPFLENILSGTRDDSDQIELDNTIIRSAKEDFYNNEDMLTKGEYKFKRIEFNKNQYLYKYYIKKFKDKYVVLMLAMKAKEFKLDYLKNLIEFFVYSERPVLKLEENLRYADNINKSLILLELKLNGKWKGIFYNCVSIFYRNNKQKAYILPDYKKYKKYINLSNFNNNDEIILLPTLTSYSGFSYPIELNQVYQQLMQRKAGKALAISYYNNEI
ncbi:MAG: hypothetical protein KatS3mg129_1549 [Leptospiraceae bacterium]|nr:MAG: hypothetical protein KatS3mg129_1549 [Leptospiraceae bacterium]